MDFEPVSLNGFVGAADGAMASSSRGGPRVSCGMSSFDGSGLLIPSEQEWKDSKSISLADDPQLEAPTRILLRSTNCLLSAGQPTMLSFSSPNPLPTKNCAAPPCRSIPETPFLFCQQGGYGSGGSNGGMHGSFTRCKGPFTSSQWLELELQALIYKYILANVPIPSHLLIQIRKSLNPFVYVGSSLGSYAPNSIGWGTFHLGLSGSTDPEPGRCRRTDGKKWRCSREAVPDQKYCERHINRGRHRSRKPVESHNGQVVTGTTNTKVVPIASSPSASVMCSSGTSKSLGQTQHQFKSLQPTTANPSTNAVVNRMQGTQGQSVISPIINLKSNDNPFSIPKQLVPIGGSSRPEFSVVSSASLRYPSDESSYSNPRNCDSFLSFNDQETHHVQPLRHFMNDFKNQSERLTVSWPEEFKSEWNQLSMSIPMASCDFSSCSNSPRQEKFTLTPLSLPCELDSINMSLGALNDPIKEPTNWIPVTWGNSMGGPLGEALNCIPSSVEANKSSLVLNLMTEAWDGRPQLGSSPTGVLQKATFVSVSNSSSGNSPRADYKASGSIPDYVPCSALASSVSIPFFVNACLQASEFFFSLFLLRNMRSRWKKT